ncbi:hypothetical protein INT47_004599 [Mucor saturninus]|uniref:SH3 domain-containing protein n=1 Tax=Mucor saturninus TaxID=64648 RepID=A0A8H7VAT1_9FUNG|nr:hypothetical protein INT47_004599 [Mucor saturninus]
MSENAFAQHVLSSIRNELNLLKSHNYIQPSAYDEILRLLPSNISKGNQSNHAHGAMPTNTGMPNGGMPGMPGMNVSSPANAPLPPPSYNSSENKLGTAEALYDYTGDNMNTDLSFRRGDIIQLTELVNDDWWKGTLHGKNGIFPRSYVKKIKPAVSEKKPPPPPQRDSYPPPPPSQQRDSYGYSPVPPKQESYNYPPPPQNSSYAAPPSQSYAAPPPASNNYASQYPPPQQQVSNYSVPPPLASTASAPAVVESHHEESKMSGFGKKIAGNVANAATWGFGATIGGNVANSIF